MPPIPFVSFWAKLNMQPRPLCRTKAELCFLHFSICKCFTIGKRSARKKKKKMWEMSEMGSSQCALVNIPICRPVLHCLVERFCVQIHDPNEPFPAVREGSWSRKAGEKTGLENYFPLHNKKIVLFFLIYICCICCFTL